MGTFLSDGRVSGNGVVDWRVTTCRHRNTAPGDKLPAVAPVLNFQAFLAAYQIRPDRLVLTNMSIAVILFALGGLVVFEALRVWRMTRRELPPASARASW